MISKKESALLRTKIEPKNNVKPSPFFICFTLLPIRKQAGIDWHLDPGSLGFLMNPGLRFLTKLCLKKACCVTGVDVESPRIRPSFFGQLYAHEMMASCGLRRKREVYPTVLTKFGLVVRVRLNRLTSPTRRYLEGTRGMNRYWEGLYIYMYIPSSIVLSLHTQPLSVADANNCNLYLLIPLVKPRLAFDQMCVS